MLVLKFVPPLSMSSETLSWYCFRSQPKRERIAVESIRREVGLEAFSPRFRFFKKTRSGKKRFVEALFPGYIFVNCDLNLHLRHAVTRRGVMGVVKYGPRIPEILPAMISDLQSEFSEVDQDLIDIPEDKIEPGCEVDIVSGSFASMKAVVTQLIPAKQRVAVLLDILGREVSVELSEEELMCAG